MKVVTFEDISRLNIAPEQCFKWVDEMIAGKQNVLLPPKISMKPFEGVFCNVMPCIIQTSCGRIGGVKVVTRYPERKPSLDSRLMLFNADTGEFLALMDADWITAMRTGAVAAHSIKLFAKSSFRNISVMGLGNTARAAMLVLASVMPDREFDVKLLRYKDQAELFAERFAAFRNFRFSTVDSVDSLIKGADVVLSAVTYFDEDVCGDENFDEGVLIVPIHTRGFTNCDLFFDKVFADDYGHVHHFKNFSKFNSFAEVSDVVNGRVPGRENDRERILAYNIGVSMHDMNYAAHIWDMIKNDTALQNIDLKTPAEKFWV